MPMNLIPPSGPIPEKTFELVVKALAFTTVAVRLATESGSSDPEFRCMETLLVKLVADEQTFNELESWAMRRLLSPA